MNAANFYPLYLKSENVVIDNRLLQPGDIFFAFSGETFNAASRAQDAIKQGATAVIVEDAQFEDTENNIFYVPSTLEFLQDLATFHRTQLPIPIIALTGSNGKTTTKEIMHAVLSQKFNVQYTKGNLNNHIGVPLTLLSVRSEHQMAVIEMGANHQKEIELLCKIAQPNIGYITNFGKAHLEGFGGVEGVIKGKAELYDFLKSNNQTILINDNDSVQIEKAKGYNHIISFGSATSDFQFEAFTENNFVGISFNKQNALSQLTGNYNYTNLCAAVALGLYFKVDSDLIKSAIENYVPTNMRSQVVKNHGKTLVLDTYNANPSSMTESLNNFTNFGGSKTIIIGDMLELGEDSVVEHRQILALAKSLNFDTIITVGPNFLEVNTDAGAFRNTDELTDYLKNNPIETENVLLKGSRGIALEKIIEFIS